MRALLKLLRCEFAKLKRKPLFFAAAAISALIPLGCALFLPEMQEFSSGAEAVDRLMSTLFQLSAYLLLMPAVVVLASNLLFEEQDNDTLKNLMTVPVSKPALALAKMTLLFLFSIAFMAVGGLVNLAIILASGLAAICPCIAHCTDAGIDGSDLPLLCDNIPDFSGHCSGVSGIPDIDRAGL